MKKLKCFIALSFGSTQIDEIYTRAILPSLKKLNISPLRVDRINHNKKIDLKIIELIQSCDFAIADLTFARPSVYFEAGFIEGLGKSVIYLARDDHFAGKPEDHYGNEKIHFDLITKNIIAWSSVNSKLEKKLISRIKLIIKPILKRVLIDENQTMEHQKFQANSLSERLKIIETLLIKQLVKNKYKEFSIKGYWMHKLFEKKDTRILFLVYESITINDIRDFAQDISMILSEKGKKNVIGYICSLNPVPMSRIEKGLYLYKQESKNVFINDKNKIYIIDPIKSESSFHKQISLFEI